MAKTKIKRAKRPLRYRGICSWAICERIIGWGIEVFTKLLKMSFSARNGLVFQDELKEKSRRVCRLSENIGMDGGQGLVAGGMSIYFLFV